jgi:hypothetical protein
VVGASVVAAAAIRVVAAAVRSAVGVHRRLREYGWAELAARLEYGCGRGQHCDL